MKKYLVMVIFLFNSYFAQTVYEPLYRDIYNFLSRLSQKGVIVYDDNIKPVTRKYIAGKLIEIEKNKDQLTSLELDELQFFKRDFGLELQNIHQQVDHLQDTVAQDESRGSVTFAGADAFGRWRLVSYSNPVFNINASPILGLESGSKDSKDYLHGWAGLYFYGYLGEHFGFSFDFRNNFEKGNGIDIAKQFTPVTGIIVEQKTGKNIQYSEVRTTLSYDWNWGNITAAKDFMEWGYGESGRLVLSQKAPSFSFVKLDIDPASWLRFNYFIAWLSSDVVDSNEIYSSLRSNPKFDRILFREKYLASHSLRLTPLKGLDISLGESIILSDRLEIAYLFPVNVLQGC